MRPESMAWDAALDRLKSGNAICVNCCCFCPQAPVDFEQLAYFTASKDGLWFSVEKRT